MNYKDALNNFIDEMGYLKNRDVEGIVFYGSFHTNTYNEYSDIDLMVLFNDNSDANQIKGFKKSKGIEVEYFERTISKIYERANSDYMKCEDSLLSMLGYGEIIFDRNGQVAELAQYIKEKYSKPLPTFTKHEAIYEIASLRKAVIAVDQLRMQHDPYFENFYFVTIERIRDFYHKLNGFSNLSQMKVTKLYTDEDIRKAQHKKMPEDEFINLFFEAIEEGTSKAEKVQRINKFFNYAIRDYSDIDYENLRIDLGRKRY